MAGMGHRKLGLLGSFGSGNICSGCHQSFLWFFLLMIGVSALAMTLLLGSFLWGFVSRKKKTKRAATTPFSDLYPPATYKPNTVIALYEFAKPIPASLQKVAGCEDNTFFDSVVFDAKQGYAQVFTDAQSNDAAASRKKQSDKPATGRNSPAFWHQGLSRSSSVRSQQVDLNTLEARCQLNSLKSWKKLLSWKKCKPSTQLEYSVSSAFHSSASTPVHRASAPCSPRKVARPQRSRSGPLYSDGSPITPRHGRSLSGPLSACSTPSRDGLNQSPYMPLKKHGSASKIGFNPLYLS